MTFILIALISLIQSLFGVGILLFGTPIFIVLDYDFESILFLLLPCSITVGTLQIFQNKTELSPKDLRITLGLIPGTILGSLLTLYFVPPEFLKSAVGLLMILSTFIRITLPKVKTRSFGYKISAPLYLAVGVIHGLTNMGGALLTLLVWTETKEKTKMRTQVAFGYLIMALSQLCVLTLKKGTYIGPNPLYAPLLAGLIFLVFGQKIFQKLNEQAYQNLMTTLLFIFGLKLLI